jgi:hypothetical protein
MKGGYVCCGAKIPILSINTIACGNITRQANQTVCCRLQLATDDCSSLLHVQSNMLTL